MLRGQLHICVLLLLTLTACKQTVPTDAALMEAAIQGDAQAQLRLGIACDEAADYAEAVKWYRLAAQQGLPQAQNNLGVMYKDGQGVAQDYGQAVAWFQKAAHQGNLLALSNLGYMYQAGLGVARDYAAARRCYMEAARRGHSVAQKNLAIMYRDGLGMPVDSDSARYWYQQAKKAKR